MGALLVARARLRVGLRLRPAAGARAAAV